MTAAHYDLDNLTAIVDRNRLQQGARTEETKQLEPLADKWSAFGLEVRDGRRPRPRRSCSRPSQPSTTGRPVAVIANTIKGKGVSFMEDRVEWHHKVPERRAGPDRPAGADPMTSSSRPTRRPTTAARPSPTTLIELARADERIVAVCNDSVGSTNLVGFREEFPDRLINVGIAEQDLVGVGAGLANGGLHPVRLAPPRRS